MDKKLFEHTVFNSAQAMAKHCEQILTTNADESAIDAYLSTRQETHAKAVFEHRGRRFYAAVVLAKEVPERRRYYAATVKSGGKDEL